MPAEWRNKMTVSDLTKLKRGKSKPVTSKPKRPAQLCKLLARKSGVSIAQLQKTFGWQRHTARAAISAQRKTVCTVLRTDTDKGSVYRIVEEGGSQ